ncbi:unnamed protein product [Ectocarpus sp. 12 AP-2014]
MRISLLQLCFGFLAVCLVLGEQVEEAPSSNLFKKFFTKTKNGLAKVRKSLAVKKDKAVDEEDPLGEGVEAVLAAIDEFVAEGEKNTGKAAKDVKKVVDETKESVKSAISASKDKLNEVGADIKSTVDAAVEGAAADVEAVRGSLQDGIKNVGDQVTEDATEAAESAAAASNKAQEDFEETAEKAFTAAGEL